MNFPRMLSLAVFAGALSLGVLPIMPGHGQTTAATSPVGYLQVPCLASSDTLVAIPFARPTAFTGAVASVSGTASNVISFTATPGFTAGQFVFNPGGSPAVTDHFYLAVGPAPLSLPGTVSVTQGSPTVTGTGTTFTSLAAGDRMSINDGYNVQTYTVTAVASDTVLTLDRAYTDAAASASTGNSTASGATSSSAASTASTATVSPAASVVGTASTTTASPDNATPTTTATATTATPPTIAASSASAAPTPTPATTPTTIASRDSATPTTTATATTTTVAKTVVTHRPVKHRPETPTAPTTVTSKSKAHTMAVEPARRLAVATKDMATAATTTNTATPFTLSGLTATYDHSPYEGRWYMVTANDANTVTVNLNGDTLPASLASAGTQVSIVPCWTFDTLFPAANANVSFTPSQSVLQLRTQVLIPDYAADGINLAFTAQYYYLSGSDATNVGWRLYGDDPTVDHGTDYLLPDGHFTVRNDNGAPTLPVTFNGSVSVNKIATALNTSPSEPQDCAVGLNRPIATPLNALGLTPADHSFQASASVLFLNDQLLVFDNTQASINRAVAAQYYYINSGPNVGWRLYGDDPTVDHGNDSIPAASALIIRKAAVTANTATPFWSNAPNY